MTENANRPGSAREEAERLVAAALAAASVAARGITRDASPLAGAADLAGRLLAGSTGGHVATGSPECCVCPVCRAIAAVRDPSPEMALKLALGASDLASGLTGVLRSVGDLVAGARPAPSAGTAADRPRTGPDPDSVWHTATTRRPAGDRATRPSAGDPPTRRPGDAAAGQPGERPARTIDEQPMDWVEPDDPWHAATTAPAPPSGPPASGDEPAPPVGA
jgi:hypothetical protein